jgi:hypothetical protein
MKYRLIGKDNLESVQKTLKHVFPTFQTAEESLRPLESGVDSNVSSRATGICKLSNKTGGSIPKEDIHYALDWHSEENQMDTEKGFTVLI